MNPLRLLEELIVRPSVNPAFVPPDDPDAGEERVAAFIAETGRRAGLDVAYQDVAPARQNVLLTYRPRGPIRQRLLLAPHMDTVGVTTPSQLKPARRGGRLYGRGACDTKGSVAAMLGALLTLSRLKQRPQHTEITLAALVDEESMQSGSRRLARSRLRAHLAIVGEPTELRVITAHKGDLWLELSTRGTAAHGARPELGDNAIHRMARVVHALETKYAAQLRRRRHPLLGHATVNVGMIHGGRQPNIVPDSCSIRIDRRTIPGEKDARVKRDLVHFLRRQGETVHLTDTKAEEPAPPLETAVSHPLVKHFLAIAGQRRPAGVDFFTDAGVLASAGIPSVVFGPGNIAQAHTIDEWVEMRQVEQATNLLARFLQAQP
jgi:acetylornithine deacetylase/succinyl-diaminopimelate desuccinylase-like protein